MGKLVVLKIGEGSFEQGFPVTLQFGEEGQRPAVETIGRLPAAPELRQAYHHWATAYRNLSQRLRFVRENSSPSPPSPSWEPCLQAAHALVDSLNRWLYTEAFRSIREKLLEQLMPSDQVRMIMQTASLEVRRLPWHLWDFCDRYPKTEIALGSSIYQGVDAVPARKLNVHMLAILGNSAGIDIPTDRKLLEQLPGAEVSLLVEPTRQALTQELWRQSWDILFFAGHSYSSDGNSTNGSSTNGNSGQIALNQTDLLTLDQLKYALRRAVGRGLQIAIFNCCDGLGLARELEDLKIPQMVVMREPVPDQVAQEFLKAFLTTFATGESFYLSVRQARETLQGIEDEFPCAAWLPVICQNPAVIPPTWEALGGTPSTLDIPDLETHNAAEWMQNQVEQLPLAAPEPLINDRYQIQRLLGQGGFGRTYLAADTYRFGDLCVLKQFAPANRAPAILQRSRELFEREAKVLYQISHPQIPKFLAWFTQSDQLYIVEEFIDGKTYLELLEERKRQGTAFSEPEVIQWLQDLLPLLEYLHGIHIIHRDISPGNVMLPQGKSQPVLIDFGVVKEVASQIWSKQTGSFLAFPQASRVGKPGYSPREQMQFGQCYPSSDLYALAMTALVLLTGRSPQWLLERCLPEPQWHLQIPLSEPFYQVLNKMLADNPRQRYPNSRAVLEALQFLGQPLPNQPLPLEPPSVTIAPSAFSLPPPSIVLPAAPVLPAVPPPLPADTPSLDPEFLQYCQRELVRCVGPMATYLLEDILSQTPQLTAHALIETLVTEIPNPQQSKQFRVQSTAFLQQLIHRRTGQGSPSSSGQSSGKSQASNPSVSGQNRSQSLDPPRSETRKSGANTASGISQSGRSSFVGAEQTLSTGTTNAGASISSSPAFLECCRRELARHIGPMANCIIDDLLEESPHMTVQQFVDTLAAEIPDLRQAEAFRQPLLAKL